MSESLLTEGIGCGCLDLHIPGYIIKILYMRQQGVETVFSSANTLQEEASIDSFLNVVATETVQLFEYLAFDFLTEYFL